jgi:hypothetical protein
MTLHMGHPSAIPIIGTPTDTIMGMTRLHPITIIRLRQAISDPIIAAQGRHLRSL